MKSNHCHKVYGLEELNHLVYSPDLSPSDYFLFHNMKKHFFGCCFSSSTEIKGTFRVWGTGQRLQFFSDFFTACKI